MNIGLIGSVAINLWMPLGRSPSDLDIVCTYDDLQDFVKALKASGERVLRQYPIDSGKKVFIQTDKTIIEAEIAWPDSSAESLLRLIMSETGTGTTYAGVTLMAPRLDVLYMLKCSHKYLKNSPHFLKTRQDILKMEALGCTIRPEHMEFFKEREKATYTYAHPKLNVSKDGFFDNQATGVYQKYAHDDIHVAVAVGEQPAYKYFQPEDAEVMCSKEMFFACSEEIRLNAVLEESYVLALERSLVPYPNGKTPKEAFDMALMRVCTSITSGWFREFSWNSYDKVQALYSDDYVTKFEAGVASGVVKLNESA